jgi:hypothetical protein
MRPYLIHSHDLLWMQYHPERRFLLLRLRSEATVTVPGVSISEYLSLVARRLSRESIGFSECVIDHEWSIRAEVPLVSGPRIE